MPTRLPKVVDHLLVLGVDGVAEGQGRVLLQVDLDPSKGSFNIHLITMTVAEACSLRKLMLPPL